MKILFFLLLIVFVDAIPIQGRGGLPNGWKNIGKPHPEESLTFRIVLKQCNLNALDKIFWDVTNPDSPNYGHYLTPQEIYSLVDCHHSAPVYRWLQQTKKNFPQEPLQYHSVGHSIKITTTVSLAEKLLETTFIKARHSKHGTRIIQLGSVSVPHFIHDSIEMILGISEFFHGTKIVAHRADKSKKIRTAHYDPDSIHFTDPYITPNGLRRLYNVPKNQQGNHPSNLMGVAAFDDSYDTAALCQFQSLFDDYNPSPIIHREGTINGTDQIESDLDVQYITAMGYGIPTLFRNHEPGEWILDWALEVVNSTHGPLVWSISYGWPEVWQCITVDGFSPANCPAGYDYKKYIDATNIEIQKMGTMGISVFVSSGDDGTPGFADNCPLDPKAPYSQAGIYTCQDVFQNGECNCNELQIQLITETESYICQYPIGYNLGTEDCQTALDNDACTKVLEDFKDKIFVQSNKSCNKSLSGEDDDAPFFYSNCTCDAFKPITARSGNDICIIQGYSFNKTNGPAFLPDFPTTSPYVTSVGATASQYSGDPCTASQLLSKPEIYCTQYEFAGYSGGGGFSSFLPRPAYQDDFVKKYLAIAPNLPPKDVFNVNGRAYPDISLNGHNYITTVGITEIYQFSFPNTDQGSIDAVSGTSASSPALAGLISLLNDILLTNGNPPVGFLNPLLYKMAREQPSIFHDIVPQKISIDVNGRNMTFMAGLKSSCSRGGCCQYGFEVTKGYDAATGLGTPDWGAMKNYLLKFHENRKKQ